MRYCGTYNTKGLPLYKPSKSIPIVNRTRASRVAYEKQDTVKASNANNFRPLTFMAYMFQYEKYLLDV